jgi:hypothetical protein
MGQEYVCISALWKAVHSDMPLTFPSLFVAPSHLPPPVSIASSVEVVSSLKFAEITV